MVFMLSASISLIADISYAALVLFLIITGALGAVILRRPIYVFSVASISWVASCLVYLMLQETPMWRFPHHLMALLLLAIAIFSVAFIARFFRIKKYHDHAT